MNSWWFASYSLFFILFSSLLLSYCEFVFIRCFIQSIYYYIFVVVFFYSIKSRLLPLLGEATVKISTRLCPWTNIDSCCLSFTVDTHLKNFTLPFFLLYLFTPRQETNKHHTLVSNVCMAMNIYNAYIIWMSNAIIARRERIRIVK